MEPVPALVETPADGRGAVLGVGQAVHLAPVRHPSKTFIYRSGVGQAVHLAPDIIYINIFIFFLKKKGHKEVIS